MVESSICLWMQWIGVVGVKRLDIFLYWKDNL